jgi:hypothetical protein
MQNTSQKLPGAELIFIPLTPPFRNTKLPPVWEAGARQDCRWNLQQVLQKPRVISTEAPVPSVARTCGNASAGEDRNRGEAEKSALKAELSTRSPQADSVEVTMNAAAYIS